VSKESRQCAIFPTLDLEDAERREGMRDVAVAHAGVIESFGAHAIAGGGKGQVLDADVIEARAIASMRGCRASPS
jgi:hypothetical protein